MTILIVAATPLEISPLITHLTKVNNGSELLTRYTYNQHTISVCITGVGMINTTYVLTRLLAHTTFDIVINTGIAGSFNTERFPIGTVVNVITDVFAEMGAENDTAFLPMSTLGFMNSEEIIVTTNCTLHNAYIQALPRVSGITVNTVHGSAKSIANVTQLYAPDVETMEGAAVLYVCNAYKIPAVQLRAISNKVEVRNAANWNIPLAIANLTTATLALINGVE
jgi:futalosine hydrolase